MRRYSRAQLREARDHVAKEIRNRKTSNSGHGYQMAAYLADRYGGTATFSAPRPDPAQELQREVWGDVVTFANTPPAPDTESVFHGPVVDFAAAPAEPAPAPPLSPERRAELLASSELGRQALADRQEREREEREARFVLEQEETRDPHLDALLAGSDLGRQVLRERKAEVQQAAQFVESRKPRPQWMTDLLQRSDLGRAVLKGDKR